MKKMVNGVVVDMTAEEIAEVTAQQAAYEAEAPIRDARTARDTGRYAELTVSIQGQDMVFDGYQLAQDNVRGAIEEFTTLDAMTRNDGTIDWTLADNSVVQLTLTDLQEVRKGFVVRYAQLHGAYTAAKNA